MTGPQNYRKRTRGLRSTQPVAERIPLDSITAPVERITQYGDPYIYDPNGTEKRPDGTPANRFARMAEGTKRARQAKIDGVPYQSAYAKSRTPEALAKASAMNAELQGDTFTSVESAIIDNYVCDRVSIDRTNEREWKGVAHHPKFGELVNQLCQFKSGPKISFKFDMMRPLSATLPTPPAGN
jgi:hypothetical protein